MSDQTNIPENGGSDATGAGGNADPTGFENTGGHPSQAEGEDPDRQENHPDPRTPGHPSQAEGEDVDG